MSISVLILLPVLLMGPVLARQVADRAMASQRAQIAVDNAAIVVGRQDRDNLNRLGRASAELHKLHLSYHSALACASTVILTSECGPTAGALRATILALHQFHSGLALAQWNASAVSGQLEVGKERSSLDSFRRAAEPFPTHYCDECGLPAGWDLNPAKLETYLQAHYVSKIDVGVRPVKVAERSWNYELYIP